MEVKDLEHLKYSSDKIVKDHPQDFRFSKFFIAINHI